jgi:hypothetical protein
MASPRQNRNKARRARHRAAEAAAAFDADQDVARRTREASDAARLARFEVQGRGYRPIFAQAPIAFGAPIAAPAPARAQIGGGIEDEKNQRVGQIVIPTENARSLGGGG